jgi:type IV pilus assembly protein PilQ
MCKAMEKYWRDCVFAFLTILLSISSVSICAEPNSAGDPQAVSQTVQQRLQTRITYSCVDLPIDTVLMNLAEQAKIDIVKSPKVTGNVTVKVTDIPLEEALSNILAAYDYTYIATESMIRVVPLSEIAVAREPVATRIYRITYADANEVAGALGNFISPQGKIALNKGTSHIIVTDTESKIKGIDKFIEEIDQATPQVLVEVRIYDITSQEGFELGTEWSAGRNTPLKTTEHLRTDIDTDFPTTDKKITEYTETTSGYYRDSSDAGPKSFTVTGTETESKSLPMGTFFDADVERYTTQRRKPFVGGTFDRINGGTLSFSLLDDAVDIDFMLSLLHQQVEAKLLANPRVLVLDNETADFEIVREIPYRELEQIARQGPITYTAFKDVGVHLKVTPHIARDGMIRLHIVPEFGVVVSQDALRVLIGQDKGQDAYQNVLGVPTVDTRRADTIAMIKDGQTIVIGGLRKKETTKDISKVPVLGDIPIVGGLFQSETESKVTRELVVFITPRIVTEPVLSEAEKKQLDATEFAGPEITKMRLEDGNQPETDVNKPAVTELTELLEMLSQKDEP